MPEVCWEWAKSDTFSIRPFEFGTAVAGILGDHEEAIKMAQAGLKIRPTAHTMLNAMAFSLASTGQVLEAVEYLSKIRHADNDTLKLVTAANWGLIAFRSGDVESGRELYRRTIDGFNKLNRPDLATRARAFLAREAFAAELEDAGAILLEAKESAKAHVDAENDHVLRLVEGVPHPEKPVQPKSVSRQPRTVVATFPWGEQRKFVIRPR